MEPINLGQILKEKHKLNVKIQSVDINIYLMHVLDDFYKYDETSLRKDVKQLCEKGNSYYFLFSFQPGSFLFWNEEELKENTEIDFFFEQIIKRFKKILPREQWGINPSSYIHYNIDTGYHLGIQLFPIYQPLEFSVPYKEYHNDFLQSIYEKRFNEFPDTIESKTEYYEKLLKQFWDNQNKIDTENNDVNANTDDDGNIDTNEESNKETNGDDQNLDKDKNEHLNKIVQQLELFRKQIMDAENNSTESESTESESTESTNLNDSNDSLMNDFVEVKTIPEAPPYNGAIWPFFNSAKPANLYCPTLDVLINVQIKEMRKNKIPDLPPKQLYPTQRDRSGCKSLIKGVDKSLFTKFFSNDISTQDLIKRTASIIGHCEEIYSNSNEDADGNDVVCNSMQFLNGYDLENLVLDRQSILILNHRMTDEELQKNHQLVKYEIYQNDYAVETLCENKRTIWRFKKETGIYFSQVSKKQTKELNVNYKPFVLDHSHLYCLNSTDEFFTFYSCTKEEKLWFKSQLDNIQPIFDSSSGVLKLIQVNCKVNNPITKVVKLPMNILMFKKTV